MTVALTILAKQRLECRVLVRPQTGFTLKADISIEVATNGLARHIGRGHEFRQIVTLNSLIVKIAVAPFHPRHVGKIKRRPMAEPRHEVQRECRGGRASSVEGTLNLGCTSNTLAVFSFEEEHDVVRADDAAELLMRPRIDVRMQRDAQSMQSGVGITLRACALHRLGGERAIRPANYSFLELASLS